MRREVSKLRAALATLAMIIGLAALMMSGRFGANTSARIRSSSPSSPPAAAECEGDACLQVTVAFDEVKQQYNAVNNSSDRWVRVSASNLAASSSACLGPGKAEYINLKSIVGPYHADYSEPKCGMP